MIHFTVADIAGSSGLFLFAIADSPVQPIDLHKLNIRKIAFPPFEENLPKTLGSAAMGTKGLIIANSTKEDLVAGFIVSECRNRVPWMAIYKKGQAIVFNSTSPAKAISETWDEPLPCLQCLEEREKIWLRADALYPYCKRHQDVSPHRHPKKNVKKSNKISYILDK